MFRRHSIMQGKAASAKHGSITIQSGTREWPLPEIETMSGSDKEPNRASRKSPAKWAGAIGTRDRNPATTLLELPTPTRQTQYMVLKLNFKTP